ncbi:hypothetical protein [Stenotrophomonas maltophilia]|uniref:hypothetical protein n=1 Tax=Stenotrophomonas maltophilia TaxID=40324 RepID=UPI0039C13271
MTDQTEDRFKGTGQFHPDKAWAKIVRKDKDRAFDEKYPLTWWDRFWIPTSLALLLFGIVACGGYLLLWLLSAPFA